MTSVLGKVLELFGSIKTVMMKYFDDRYVALTEDVVAPATTAVAAVGVRGEQSFQYRDFDNTKPMVFDAV